MKADLIDLLLCPVCQAGPLEIHIRDRRVQEIIEADLTCQHCGRSYPVTEGIPVMLADTDGQQRSSETLCSSSHRHREVREANIEYYDAVAEVYEDEVEQAVHQGDSNQRRVETMVKDLAEKTRNDLFLDLGCGTGNVLKLGNKYFKRAIGVDISFNMLKAARQNNLEVVQADVLSLPFHSSLFDVVSVFSVLHHIYDYQKVFAQISRVLKRGGYLYSDWDPTRKPSPGERRVAWGIYRLVHGLFAALSPIKHRLKPLLRPEDSATAPLNFMKIRPDLEEVHAKAEFHNITEEERRGIDFEKVESQLQRQGFDDIRPSYHQSGLSYDQLRGVPYLKSRLLAALGFDPEPFLENILILARKKKDLHGEISFASVEQQEESQI
jgi:ubiquinone/menaquinone biosynthesis C-methylase UbiE/uncharacterized protein YbaR (Trm112 family)